MMQSGSNKKVANSLVALSSAAVLAVYAAGYVRTRSAANRIAEQFSERRVPRAAPVNAAEIQTASLRTELRADSPTNLPPVPAVTSPPEPKPAVHEEAAAISQPSPKPAIANTASVAPAAPTPAQPVQQQTQQVASVSAPAPVAVAAPAAATPPTTPPAPWKDGTWKGWGNCQHGDIQAAVVIEDGKIASATISECWTRYSCDIIDKLPPQVVKRQTADVDRISGATQSADAFYYAVYEALRQASTAAKTAAN
jgi:uncharacterized protein with FMN-binding domain